jgi:hypothetical protein
MTTLQIDPQDLRELAGRLSKRSDDLEPLVCFTLPDTGTSAHTTVQLLATVQRQTTALGDELSQIGHGLRRLSGELLGVDLDAASTLVDPS